MFNAAKMPNAGSSMNCERRSSRAVATNRGTCSGGNLWSYCSRKLVAVKLKILKLKADDYLLWT
jgi:hypothetical protein